MGKKDKKIKNNSCDHESFWGIYKIINFNRFSSKFKCEKCKKKIYITLEHKKKMKENFLLKFFSGILWMSPAILVVIFAIYFGTIYSLYYYLLAILMIIAYHFAAMYYVIKLGLVKIKIKKFL